MKLLIAVAGLFLLVDRSSSLVELNINEARAVARSLIIDLLHHEPTVESLSKVLTSKTIWNHCAGENQVLSINEAIDNIASMRDLNIERGDLNETTETAENIAAERAQLFKDRENLADPYYSPRLGYQLLGASAENRIVISDVRGWNFTARGKEDDAIKIGIVHQSNSFYINSFIADHCNY